MNTKVDDVDLNKEILSKEVDSMVFEHAKLNDDAILDEDQMGTLSFSHETKHVKHIIFINFFALGICYTLKT
jgi:hypothetical protein